MVTTKAANIDFISTNDVEVLKETLAEKKKSPLKFKLTVTDKLDYLLEITTVYFPYYT